MFIGLRKDALSNAFVISIQTTDTKFPALATVAIVCMRSIIYVS